MTQIIRTDSSNRIVVPRRVYPANLSLPENKRKPTTYLLEQEKAKLLLLKAKAQKVRDQAKRSAEYYRRRAASINRKYARIKAEPQTADSLERARAVLRELAEVRAKSDVRVQYFRKKAGEMSRTVSELLKNLEAIKLKI